MDLGLRGRGSMVVWRGWGYELSRLERWEAWVGGLGCWRYGCRFVRGTVGGTRRVNCSSIVAELSRRGFAMAAETGADGPVAPLVDVSENMPTIRIVAPGRSNRTPSDYVANCG